MISAIVALVMLAWDGADYRVVSAMLAAGELPNVSRLVSFGELRPFGVTQTKPQWATMLSGLPWYQTGIVSNDDWQSLPEGRTIFEHLHGLGIPSAFIAGKLTNLSIAPGGVFGHVPAVTVDAITDDTLSIEQVGDHCFSDLAAGARFVFCHWKQPDRAGHEYGGGSDEYRGKLRRLDVQLGRFLDAGVRVLLASDHGFELAPPPEWYVDPVLPTRLPTRPYGWAHINQPRTIIGGSVPLDLSRPSTLDMMRTALDLMGVPAPEWADGRSLLK